MEALTITDQGELVVKPKDKEKDTIEEAKKKSKGFMGMIMSTMG